MDVHPRVQFKRLTEAVAGELVRFELRGASATAIVMRQIGQGTVCAFLETNDEARPPFYMLMTIEDLVCMSFGSDWVLDLRLDGGVFPGNNAEVPGAVLLASDVVAMHLSRPPDNIHGTAGTYDLKSFQSVSRHARVCTWVKAWQIWRSPEDQANPNAAPIKSFQAG